MRKTMLFWFYNEKGETVAASSAENAVRKYRRRHNIKGDILLIRMLGSDMAEPRNRQKSANAVVMPPSKHIRGSAYPMAMTLIKEEESERPH